MQKFKFVVVLALLVFSALIGCSEKAAKYSGSTAARPGGGGGGGGKWRVTKSEAPSEYKAKPWEYWTLGRTLQGNPIRDRSFIHADELVRSTKYADALQAYQKIDSKKLSHDETETLTARIASTQLSLDRARDSLSTVSDFFKATNRSEADVNARFSLLFAFAYGRLGEFSQSLAWFSRVYRLSSRSAQPPNSSALDAPLANAAEAGTRMLVRSIPQDALQAIGAQWSTDLFVSKILGEEQSQRTQLGYTPRTYDAKTAFWEADVGGQSNEWAANAETSTGQSVSIGVILPLTGPYASLGVATKNGIDLAIDKSGTAVRASFLDDSGDSLQASVQAREYIAAENGQILLGPIITSAAERVAEVARQSRVSQLALAKGAQFPTGESVFRLGPTSASQVRSLLEVCRNHFQVGTFALVYPDDSHGHDFADEFRTAVGDMGMQLVGEYQFARSDIQALSRIAGEVEQTNVQAVFLPDNLTSAARFFSALTPAFRQSIKALGPATWYNRTELQQSRMALEGLIFVSPFFSESARPQILNFVADYENRFQAPPDFMAAQGFDAATIALEALKRQGSLGVSLPDAIRSIEMYEGLTGKIRVESNGELSRDFTVVSFQQGQIVPIEE